MRFLVLIFLIMLVVGCPARQEEHQQAVAVFDTNNPKPKSLSDWGNPSDWGPAYISGMEFGPASMHLDKAFHQAESFIAKQPFAKDYSLQACSGGGERFVDVNFALLSDSSGKTFGTVRVDTETGECIWLGNVN
jgi:hypothetical protein